MFRKKNDSEENTTFKKFTSSSFREKCLVRNGKHYVSRIDKGVLFGRKQYQKCKTTVFSNLKLLSEPQCTWIERIRTKKSLQLYLHNIYTYNLITNNSQYQSRFNWWVSHSIVNWLKMKQLIGGGGEGYICICRWNNGHLISPWM